MSSSWCHQMCMIGKVNQGPLFDISVWCNRSLKTKLHSMIVRQYSHLKEYAVFMISIGVELPWLLTLSRTVNTFTYTLFVKNDNVCLQILERMRAPVRHISYGIRHTALCRMYGIVAYVRYNNHPGSPLLGIPALPHWHESSQLQIKL